jgi:hypothetical protein
MVRCTMAAIQVRHERYQAADPARGLPRCLESAPFRAIAGAFVAGSVVFGAAPAPAQAPTIEQLQRQLEQRDAAISDLLRRVEELERRVPATAPSPRSPARPAAVEAPEPPAAPEPEVRAEGEERDEGQEVAGAAPGAFEVDEEAADRALERTLVQAGALLLPFGTLEVEPRFGYTRRQDDAPVILTQDGMQFLVEEEVRRDDVEAGVTFRLGLPLDSQLTVDLPYSYERVSTADRARFAGLRERTDSAVGLDDVTLIFSKTLLREDGPLPNLFGNLIWDTDTGDNERRLEFGTGFHELGASLTATKRVDPLVYVGSLSYLHALEDDDLQPGDQLGLSMGAVLAVSPDSSLRFFLDQTFAQEFEVRGGEVPGTDRVFSSLRIGLSSVLSPRILLDVEASAGLTEDAPDYALRVSLPVRFDLPF